MPTKRPPLPKRVPVLPGVWYHGTTKKFDEFEVTKGLTFVWDAEDRSPSETPLFFSRNKEFAKAYTHGNGRVLTVRLKAKKVFDGSLLFKESARYWPPEKEALTPLGKKLAEDLSHNRVFPGLVSGDDIGWYEGEPAAVLAYIARMYYDVMETKEMKSWLKKQGFDAFLVREAPQQAKVENIAVFSPKQVEVVKVEREPPPEENPEDEDEGDMLYHATFLGNLDGIQANGLLPSTGGSNFGAGYGEHSRGRVFFTEEDGVFSWHHKVGAQRAPAESASDLVVVLRVLETDLFDELGLEIEEDEVGNRDVLADAVFVEGEVPAYLLDVWDGGRWVPLEDVSTEDMEAFAEERAEVEEAEEDDETVVWWDDDTFLPPT